VGGWRSSWCWTSSPATSTGTRRLLTPGREGPRTRRGGDRRGDGLGAGVRGAHDLLDAPRPLGGPRPPLAGRPPPRGGDGRPAGAPEGGVRIRDRPSHGSPRRGSPRRHSALRPIPAPQRETRAGLHAGGAEIPEDRHPGPLAPTAVLRGTAYSTHGPQASGSRIIPRIVPRSAPLRRPPQESQRAELCPKERSSRASQNGQVSECDLGANASFS
jgi:hypothetical protein